MKRNNKEDKKRTMRRWIFDFVYAQSTTYIGYLLSGRRMRRMVNSDDDDDDDDAEDDEKRRRRRR